MKTKLLLLLLLGWAGIVFGQEQKSFKEKNIINLNLNSVVYIAKDAKGQKKKVIKKNVIYKAHKDTLSFEIDTIKTPIEILFTTLSPQDTGLNCNTIKANLKVDNGKIRIYPWLFSNEKINEFFNNHDIYINMKERFNYKFRYSSYQLGIVTLPIKWYMDSKLGNVETSINAMVNAGYKFGNTRYVKFPNEEKVREYKTAFSVNLLAGVSKIELNKVNTSKSENPIEKANIAAISLGISLGFHYGDFTFMPTFGWDLPTANRKDWNFTKVPWLGLGIGYNFLKFN